MFAAPYSELTHRHLAMLRAVGAGRCELSCSCEPDLFIDGRSSCDQVAAHLLARLGLVRPAWRAAIGQRVPAELTPSGRALLELAGRQNGTTGGTTDGSTGGGLAAAA